MSTSRYLGRTRGAVVRWRGEAVTELTLVSVDRNPPKPADWLLRTTPRGTVAKPQRRPLALRLHTLSLAYHRGQITTLNYMAAVDALIAEAAP